MSPGTWSSTFNSSDVTRTYLLTVSLNLHFFTTSPLSATLNGIIVLHLLLTHMSCFFPPTKYQILLFNNSDYYTLLWWRSGTSQRAVRIRERSSPYFSAGKKVQDNINSTNAINLYQATDQTVRELGSMGLYTPAIGSLHILGMVTNVVFPPCLLWNDPPHNYISYISIFCVAAQFCGNKFSNFWYLLIFLCQNETTV